MSFSTILLAVAQTILWASIYYIFPAFLLVWESDFGWSRADLTLAITLAVLVSALFSPIVGQLIDKHQGRLMMTACSALGGICVLIMPEITSLTGFLAIWCVMGFAMAGSLYEPCFAMLVRYRGARAKRAITAVTLFAGFASTICFPLAHWLVGAYGSETAMRVFGCAALFVASPMLFLGVTRLMHEGTEEGHSVPHAAKAGPKTFLQSRVFWLITAAFSFMALNHGIVINHFLPMFQEWNFDAAEAVFAISLVGPMQVLGRVVWMMAERKIDIPKISVVCLTSLLLASICLITSDGTIIPLVFAFVALQGAAYGVMSILKPVLLRELMGEHHFGSMVGIMAVPYLIGYATAPYIGSLIWEQGSYDWVRVFIVGCSVVGVLSLLLALFFYRTRSSERQARLQV